MQMFAPRFNPDFLDDVVFGNDKILTKFLGDVIGHAGFGLVLTTADRQIVYANDAAETLMRAGNGLCRKHGCIGTTDFSSSRQLQSLIASASRQTDEPVQGGSLVLRNEDGLAPVAVHVVPLARRLALFPPDERQPAAGLLIADCQRGHDDRIKVFSELFALTPAEARVLSEAISGGGVTKAAMHLKIAQSTAQTHLKRILEKTGTHRQAELVRVFYEITIPWYGRGRAMDEQPPPWLAAWVSDRAGRSSGPSPLMPSNDCEARPGLSRIVALPSNGRAVSPRRGPLR
ncbi:MAG: helix-turn-helix transcriptional regulator [Beijerinckiaceae bacterium]|nr:helix-turn-helix transcriptional regulator [Beijerinckiaceae bacterium]